MSYQYDLSDFKRFLNNKSAKYRVDGLIFWQNRIPIPIDLFNRIFNESDEIVIDYVYQVAASAVVFSNRSSFVDKFNIDVVDLPSGALKNQAVTLEKWLQAHLSETSAITRIAYEIADVLGLEGFHFTCSKVVSALQHQGKKYSRIFMPREVRKEFQAIPNCDEVGQDNTDMFGNIIADRYNIYRSGFSDALAIIFNALLEFRILCSGRGGHLQRISVNTPMIDDIDVRMGKTTDGSLWEPRYEDDYYIILNSEHPLVRHLSTDELKPLAECLFYLGEFESGQFSEANKKLIENLRQAVSRSLWIKHD